MLTDILVREARRFGWRWAKIRWALFMQIIVHSRKLLLHQYYVYRTRNWCSSILAVLFHCSRYDASAVCMQRLAKLALAIGSRFWNWWSYERVKIYGNDWSYTVNNSISKYHVLCVFFKVNLLELEIHLNDLDHVSKYWFCRGQSSCA